MGFPRHVFITEVGPRDGLQMETIQVPTDEKVALIEGLVQAGLPAIQIASFVHPLRVPQMADAEEVIRRLPMDASVRYSALALNLRGVQRALETAIPWIEISAAASDAHSRANSGLPMERLMLEVEKMVNAAVKAGRSVRASIQCTFGCADEEHIPDKQIVQLAQRFLEHGVHELILADTTGMGTPLQVKRLLEILLPLAGGTPVGLHLHDTRGMGLVNVMAGLEMGISRFDSSLGGLGGCPFVAGAAGNIATEDTVYLLNALGIETGIHIPDVAYWSHRMSRMFERTLSGKIYRLHPDDRGPVCASSAHCR